MFAHVLAELRVVGKRLVSETRSLSRIYLLGLTLLCCLLAGAGARALALEPAQTGAITGTVMTDWGPLVDRAIMPIPGATLMLAGLTNNLPKMVTGQDGAFKFDAVLPGPYILYAEAPGFEPNKLELTMTAGETKSVTISLKPVVATTGQVQGVVTNRLTHEPVAGAFIILMPLPLMNPLPQAPQVLATTDAKGSFTLDAVPPGTRELVVERGDYLSSTSQVPVSVGQLTQADFKLDPNKIGPGFVEGVVYDPDTQAPLANVYITADTFPVNTLLTTDAQGYFKIGPLPVGPTVVRASLNSRQPVWQTVEVKPGETAKIELLLAKPTPTVGVIEGRVKDAVTGAAVNGAAVWYAPAGMVPMPPRDAAGNIIPDPAVCKVGTDGNGHYRIPDLKAGPWQLTVECDGYAEASKVVDVSVGTAAQADFQLTPQSPAGTGSIAGFVYIDPGASASPLEKPIAGATVVLMGDAANAARSAVTGEDGSFKFGDVPAGRVIELYVKAPGFAPGKQNLSVTAGETAPVTFHLKPVVNSLGEIQGVVTDKLTGNPLANAFVLVRQALWRSDATPFTPLTTWTDTAGRYALAQVPAGVNEVVVERGDYLSSSSQVEVQAGLISLVNFALKQNPSTNPSGIAGVVRDAATQAPLKDVIIQIDGWPVKMLITTNELGAFIALGVPIGPHRVHVQLAGYDPGALDVEVKPGEVGKVEFALKKTVPAATGVIEGFVRDALTGAPLKNALIIYTTSGMRPMPPTAPGAAAVMILPPNVSTDDAGHYRIPDLAQGEWQLNVVREGYEGQTQIVEALAGATTQKDFKLNPQKATQTGTLTGTVFNGATGQPIASAQVFYGLLTAATNLGWQDQPPADQPYVKTDAQGRFTAPDLQPGLYTLLARVDGFEPGHATAQVAEGGTADVTIKLTPAVVVDPGAIKGRVTDAATNKPLAGATVIFAPLAANMTPQGAIQADTALPSVTTDADGYYVIENRKPGLYWLAARQTGYTAAERKVEVKSGATTEVNFALTLYVAPLPGAIKGQVTDAATQKAIAGARVYYRVLPDDPAVLDARSGSSEAQANGANYGTGTGASAEPGAVVGAIPEPPSVVTGADGTYAIPDVMPGSYYLLAKAEGYQAQDQVTLVKDGQTVAVDFALKTQLTGVGTVQGQISDALTGQALPGATVLVSSIVDPRMMRPTVIYGKTLTDDQGKYRLENIPAGPVRVDAYLDGYRTGGREANVPASSVETVNLALQPIPATDTGSLVGTVRDGAVAQGSTDQMLLTPSSASPLAGVMVMLAPKEALSYNLSKAPNAGLTALTDEQGQYVFAGVPVGDYTVVAAKAGYLPGEQAVAIAAGQTAQADFLLQPAPQPEAGALGGTVTDAGSGKPLAGVRIELFTNNLDWLAKNSEWVTLTDDQGAWEFPKLLVGQYQVSATKPGYDLAQGEAEVKAGATTELNLTLKAVPVGAVAGVVTDGLTGKPVVGAVVYAPPIDHPYAANAQSVLFAKTDTMGSYKIEGVPAGQRIVVAFQQAYYEDAQTVNVIAGSTAKLDFALLPRPVSDATWKINVVDAKTGQPLPGVAVNVPVSDWLTPGSAWDPWSGQTDATGAALLKGLPAGQWTVVGSLPGYKVEAVALAPDGDGTAAQSGVNTLTLYLTPEPAVQLENAARGWAFYE